MLVLPFHSRHVLAAKVHHNQAACAAGEQVATPYMRDGTAGYPLCGQCAEIADNEGALRLPERLP